MTVTTIYKAKKIATMDPLNPYATCLAISGDEIVGVGGEDIIAAMPNAVINTSFEDRYLLPGFIEGHCHATEGCMWQYPYIGYFDRESPDGDLWSGLNEKKRIIALLKSKIAQAEDLDSFIAWGYDPIYFSSDERLTRNDLDEISQDIPILIFHASFHILIANSCLLRKSNLYDKRSMSGLVRDPDGELTGELQGFAARHLALSTIGWNRYIEMSREASLWNFANSAKRAGVTTATDLANTLPEDAVSNLLETTAAKNYPLRIVVALLGNSMSPADASDRIGELVELNTEKLKFGPLKLTVDGSIQGFTARMLSPGYYNGAENGLWYVDPTELSKMLAVYKDRGIQVHAHVNGDEAIDTMLKSIDDSFEGHPRDDHRWTLQHFQLASEQHFAEAARLGICVNLFANHIYYWGDIHSSTTVGPEKAKMMDSAALAKQYKVPYSIHSDAPITPLAPLFTAWCAVNRQTSSGKILGEEHRISVDDALHAITLGAAYTLKLDHEIGSLEKGKKADLAILEADPYTVDSMNIKDIPIWGTMVGGAVFVND